MTIEQLDRNAYLAATGRMDRAQIEMARLNALLAFLHDERNRISEGSRSHLLYDDPPVCAYLDGRIRELSAELGQQAYIHDRAAKQAADLLRSVYPR